MTHLFRIPVQTVLLVVVLSACFQVPDTLAAFALARAVQIDLPLLVFFVINPLVYISTNIPLSLGGLGVREGVLVLLLSSQGVSPSSAVLLAFLIYMSHFASYTLYIYCLVKMIRFKYFPTL